MPTFITRRFQITRDFRTVVWGSTLQYNLLRSFCAGLVLGVFMLFLPQAPGDGALALATIFLWPIAYLIVFLPIGLLLVALSQFYPVFGVGQMFLSSIAVAIGDPLVLLVERWKPALVPVQNPPIIYFRLIVFLLRRDETTEIIIASS